MGTKLLPNNPIDYTWTSVGGIIGNAITIALSVAGAVAAIYIIIGAIQYFTAYGDEAKATAAKNTITYAIIGAILIVVARLIIVYAWQFVTPETLTI